MAQYNSNQAANTNTTDYIKVVIGFRRGIKIDSSYKAVEDYKGGQAIDAAAIESEETEVYSRYSDIDSCRGTASEVQASGLSLAGMKVGQLESEPTRLEGGCTTRGQVVWLRKANMYLKFRDASHTKVIIYNKANPIL